MPLPAAPAPTNLATLTGWVRVSANSAIIIPANCVLLYATLAELNGLSGLTLSMGTTSGAADVMPTSSGIVGAGGLELVPASSFSTIWFSRKLTQPLWLSSAAWPENALVSAQLVYQPGP